MFLALLLRELFFYRGAWAGLLVSICFILGSFRFVFGEGCCGEVAGVTKAQFPTENNTGKLNKFFGLSLV